MQRKCVFVVFYEGLRALRQTLEPDECVTLWFSDASKVSETLGVCVCVCVFVCGSVCACATLCFTLLLPFLQRALRRLCHFTLARFQKLPKKGDMTQFNTFLPLTSKMTAITCLRPETQLPNPQPLTDAQLVSTQSICGHVIAYIPSIFSLPLLSNVLVVKLR